MFALHQGARLRAGARRAARSCAVTTLSAVEPRDVCPLRETLKSYRDGPSPLARLDDVHFARWVVIDELKTDFPGAPRRRPRLKSAYLLFDATVTIPAGRRADFPEVFFADIWACLPAAAHAVWGHCVGYPGAAGRDAFVAYLMAARLPTAVHRFGYPGATVDDVRRALKLRDDFARFALDHQGD